MTLIKSISGIRGTIGGREGEGLTPLDIVKFTAAFGKIIQEKSNNNKVVLGRDARVSGEMVRNLVVGTLQSIGMDVIDLGLSTTPTVELAVPLEQAAGGIILTASHNPGEWNALKLLNAQGEFISAAEGLEVLERGDKLDFDFAGVEELGTVTENDTYLKKHVDHVLALDLVDAEAIRQADFTIAVDAVNSTGGIFVPALLEALGVKTIFPLYCEPTGIFAHNPEPLAANLTALSKLVVQQQADLGIAVDPDVDRLCFVMEDGAMFGEEYTLVAVSDYVLQHTPGPTVSNLSSTRALRDVTERTGNTYFAAAVGEVNVVTKMKEVNAVIGGEGNGGIIYPASHYGRDALVGIALFLTHLARHKAANRAFQISDLRNSYPAYFMAKDKIALTPGLDVDRLLLQMQAQYKSTPHSMIDGLKIDFENEWVHLRKSNTEPIVRIYVEAPTQKRADELAAKMSLELQRLA